MAKSKTNPKGICKCCQGKIIRRTKNAELCLECREIYEIFNGSFNTVRMAMKRNPKLSGYKATYEITKRE